MGKKRRPPRVRKEELAEDEIEYEEFPIPEEDDLNNPPDSILEYMTCIYGTKAVGKSTLASSWPDSITAMFEPKRLGLKIRMVQMRKISAAELLEDRRKDPWPSLKAWVRRIIDEDAARCINFDTVDLVYEACHNHVAAKNGVLSPGKAGKDSSGLWIELREEFQGFFNEIRFAGIGINLISHVKERDLEIVGDGESMQMYGPSCAPACMQYIKSACDFAFFYGFDGNLDSGRQMVIRDPSNKIWTGCNPEGRFMQPDGKPLYRIEMPTDKSQGFEVLQAAFNNELWDVDTPEDERGSEPKKKKKKK